MSKPNLNRRELTTILGAGLLAGLAGCIGDDLLDDADDDAADDADDADDAADTDDTSDTDDGDNGDNGDNGDPDDSEPDNGDNGDNGDPDDSEPDNGDNGDNGDGDDEDDTPEITFQIEPGTTIHLDGHTAGWIGIAPEQIEGEENPALSLAAGETYEIGWSDGDGGSHNIAIHDDEGYVVNEYQTDQTTQPDEDQFFEFEATTEMYEYVCEPHRFAMSGRLVVE